MEGKKTKFAREEEKREARKASVLLALLQGGDNFEGGMLAKASENEYDHFALIRILRKHTQKLALESVFSLV